MSNIPPISQVPLSDDSNATFLIRWRGRQEGPYTAAVIEAKLAANQIGLLHEIAHNGQWVTLREFFAEREAVIRSENQAREEEKRRAREEAERQTREREERRQAELLSEERRKNDLLQASMAERQRSESPGHSQPVILKPHRAGTILTLGNRLGFKGGRYTSVNHALAFLIGALATGILYVLMLFVFSLRLWVGLWMGNAVARRHKCLNSRNLAAAKDNAGTEIVLAAKTHRAIAEAVVFLTQNEFFGLQIFLENCPFAREWMTRMKR